MRPLTFFSLLLRPIKELDGIINQLSTLFEIDLTSIDDFKAYNYYQYSFPELFSAGTKNVYEEIIFVDNPTYTVLFDLNHLLLHLISPYFDRLL